MITLGGGTTSLSVALQEYQTAWKGFLVVHRIEMLEHVLLPTTISWKVADKSALFANLEALSPFVEQVHIGTVDNRYIASAVLHEAYQSMRIIKILERRKGSHDALGLDGLDFIAKDPKEIYAVLEAAGVHVEQQHNAMHDWISLRFGKQLEYEAKITDHLVLGVAIRELEQAVSTIV